MNCNQKMFLISELQTAVDNARIKDPSEHFEGLNDVVMRGIAISEQYQSGDPFKRVIDFIVTDAQIEMSAIAGEHFSEVVR